MSSTLLRGRVLKVRLLFPPLYAFSPLDIPPYFYKILHRANLRDIGHKGRTLPPSAFVNRIKRYHAYLPEPDSLTGHLLTEIRIRFSAWILFSTPNKAA